MVLERHYISYATIATVGIIVLWFITAIASFTMPSEFGWIMFPIQIFVFLVLPVLVYGLGYLYVKGHRYIITNERIIMFRKFIGILMRTVTHDKITDIIVNQGSIGRLLNYGRVSPITAGMIMPMGAAIFSISGVKNPYEGCYCKTCKGNYIKKGGRLMVWSSPKSMCHSFPTKGF